MLNSYATMRNDVVLGFLLFGQLLSTRFLVWLGNLNAVKREADEAKVLQQFAPLRQRIERLVSNWLVVCTSFVRITQKRNAAAFVSKQDIFYAVSLFLAAITCFLLIAILGATDWPFGAIVKKRGDVLVSVA